MNQKIRVHLNFLPCQTIPLNFNSLLALILLITITLSFSGCDLKLPPMPWDPPKKETKDDKAKESEPSEAEAAEETEPTGPPDETALLPAPMHQLPYEEVTISLADQLILYGRLYDPSLTSRGENELPDAEEYAGPKYPLVILLHGLNRSHLAWSDLPATLTKAGYAVFAVDLRGHGKSTVTTWKRRVNWRYLTPEQWKTMHRDIGQVISFFKKGEFYPEVDGTHVAVVGEKMGANIATFVGKNNPEVKALVLMSPGLEFKGIDASRGLLEYDNNTLIMSNQDMKESHNQARHLYNWITGPKTLQVYEKIGEGADMLSNQPSVGDQIRDWLTQSLTPVGGKSPAATPITGEASTEPVKDETPVETGHNSPAAKHDAEKASTPSAPAKPAAAPAKAEIPKAAHH